MRTEAEIFAAAKDGSPFSNHSEYEIWASKYCYECVHDDAEREIWCPILGVALLGRWPAEWTRGTVDWTVGDASGSYECVDTCTEFEERPGGPDDGESPEPPPPPRFDPEMPGQVDMFEVFVEQGLTELAEQPQAVTA